MSFGTHATCDMCGVTAPTREDGELPKGWFAVLEKTRVDQLENTIIVDQVGCLLDYAQRRADTQTPAREVVTLQRVRSTS